MEQKAVDRQKTQRIFQKPKKPDKDKDKEGNKATPDPSPVNQVFELYGKICVSYPKITSYSEARKKAIKARLNSGYTVADFEKMFKKAEASMFMKGKNNRNWRATFDWMIKDANMAKVLDGNYDNNDDNDKDSGEHSYDLDEYKSLVNNF